MNCLKCGIDIGNALGLCPECKEARDASYSRMQDVIMNPKQGDCSPSFELLIPVLKFVGVVAVVFVVIFQVLKNLPDLRTIRRELAGRDAADLASKCRSACSKEQWKMCDWMHVVCSRQQNVQFSNSPSNYGAKCKDLMNEVTMAISMMKGYCPVREDAGDTSDDLLKTARENIRLPFKVDAQTTLVRFNAPDGRTFESIYIVDMPKENATAEFKDALKVAATKQNCQDKESRAGLRYGFAKLMTYLNRDATTILTQFKVEESDC